MTLAEQVLTRDEVKAFFGIGETTLCKWINACRIPMPTRIGRKTVWFKESIDAAMAAMQRKSEKGLKK